MPLPCGMMIIRIMNIEICTLCEYASEHEGRLTIVDTFDAILASKFPWRAYFHFALKINLEDGHKVHQKIKMLIIDEHQHVLFEADGPYNVHDGADKMNLVASFKGLIFNHPGLYRFQVLFDDDLSVDYPFKLVLKDEK